MKTAFGLGKVSAVSGGGGSKIKVEGLHKVKVTDVICQPSKRNPQQTNYIIEFELLSTTAEDKLSLGGTYGRPINLNDQFGYGLTETKQFLCACAGVAHDSPEADEIDDEDMERSFTTDLCEGLEVWVRTYPHETQKGFIKWIHVWSHDGEA